MSDGSSSYAAIGIPQGLITDQETGEVGGAVRRGGELVTLDPVGYGMWTTLLTPLTPGSAAAIASARGWGDAGPVIGRLESASLLARIDRKQVTNGTLLPLRPIPLGCGLGNLGGDPGRFEIQNATLSHPAPMSLDVVSVMFWWEFDAASSLQEIASLMTSRIPGLSLPAAHAIAARLAYGLMVNRMLYLDFPRGAKS
jgi:hypothetical protein